MSHARTACSSTGTRLSLGIGAAREEEEEVVEEEALESDEYEAVDATEEAMAFAGVERAGSGEVVVGREDREV